MFVVSSACVSEPKSDGCGVISWNWMDMPCWTDTVNKQQDEAGSAAPADLCSEQV